jgi:PAS domain S-box-containing protein
MEQIDSKEELKSIINSSPVITFLWKPEENWPVDFVSENILQFGYSPDNFTSGQLNYADIIHPDDLNKVKDEFSKHSEDSESKGFTHEYRIITKFSDIRWVEERTMMRRDENNNITQYLGIILDITERKKAEEKLQLNESRMESLLNLNNMSSSTLEEITDFTLEEVIKLTKSKVGYLAFLNPNETLLTMHSWSNEALKNCEVKDKKYIYPVESTGLWGEAVRQRKPIITNDYPSPNPLKKGYPEGHVELKRHMNIPIFDGDKIVAVAGVGNKEEPYEDFDVRQMQLMMDGMWELIQRREMEKALKKYSEEFAKANNELMSLDSIKKETLPNNFEHSSVTNYSEFVNSDTLDIISKKQNEIIKLIVQNSDKLRYLVDSLLYLSQERSGKLKYDFEPVNINEVIDNALMNVIFEINEKGIEFKRSIPGGLPLIKGDRKRLTYLFTTLANNAINFTPEEGEVKLNVSEENDYLHLTIEDNGPGIENDLVPNIFNKFYHISDSINFSHGGFESGLYLSKSIVDAHNGHIWIESEKGIGTTIHVKLPKRSNE